ncbi:MAG: peptidase E [Candidatus Peribacteria bacterium]|nr:peptidase E [Candidatus Peribacteria bacterium]
MSTSAGSCVAGPDIEHTKYSDDPSVVVLENYEGLNFCNVAIAPHFNSIQNTKNLLPELNFFLENTPKFVRLDLTDKQAVVGNLEGTIKIIA